MVSKRALLLVCLCVLVAFAVPSVVAFFRTYASCPSRQDETLPLLRELMQLVKDLLHERNDSLKLETKLWRLLLDSDVLRQSQAVGVDATSAFGGSDDSFGPEFWVLVCTLTLLCATWGLASGLFSKNKNTMVLRNGRESVLRENRGDGADHEQHAWKTWVRDLRERLLGNSESTDGTTADMESRLKEELDTLERKVENLQREVKIVEERNRVKELLVKQRETEAAKREEENAHRACELDCREYELKTRESAVDESEAALQQWEDDLSDREALLESLKLEYWDGSTDPDQLIGAG